MVSMWAVETLDLFGDTSNEFVSKFSDIIAKYFGSSYLHHSSFIFPSVKSLMPWRCLPEYYTVIFCYLITLTFNLKSIKNY